MKAGIYGGTFNPIHLGHIHILREFAERLGLDRVLLIPTGTPPHKAAPLLAGAEDRLAMCRLAVDTVSDVPIRVSRMEIDRGGKSYTALTLEALRGQYPQDEFYFLMGEDMLLTLDKWYRPEVICALATLCASPRSHDGLAKLKAKQRELEEKFSARCRIENIPYFAASSTQIRELAARRESLSGLVPDAVEKYIYSHGLYGGGTHDDL